MKVILKEHEIIDDLEYKGLKIIQSEDGFKFGIDSILLSDFAKEIKLNSKVVDLGTGTGILALLLSKKVKSKEIIGVEIQKKVYEMALRSVKLNNLDNKIKIINEDIKELDNILKNNYYDAIVTNPPYKKKGTGVTNENEKQLISRHEIKCCLEDIIKTSAKLLKSKGEFYMVHRPERLVDICELMRKYKIEPKKIRFIYPKFNSKPNLLLIKAVKDANQFLKIEEPLYIYDEENNYTKEVLKIYNKKD